MHTFSLTLDMILGILDMSFYNFVYSLKQHALHIPHSTTVHANCKVFNIDMSGFINVKIDKGVNGKSIFPFVEVLKGSLAVLPRSISINENFCLMETKLYDKNGYILHDKRKFAIYNRKCIVLMNE